MSDNVIFNYLDKTLPGAARSSTTAYGHEILVVDAHRIRDIAKILRDEMGFEQLLDIIAVDWSKWATKKPERFELDYLFLSVKTGQRVQLKAVLSDAEQPSLDSIAALYPSANWAERECFDMMGIHFAGHPNLKRLLMWPEFIGHPLRKDYPLNRRQPLPVSEELL